LTALVHIPLVYINIGAPPVVSRQRQWTHNAVRPGFCAIGKQRIANAGIRRRPSRPAAASSRAQDKQSRENRLHVGFSGIQIPCAHDQLDDDIDSRLKLQRKLKRSWN
jgi:hypothetical protein